MNHNFCSRNTRSIIKCLNEIISQNNLPIVFFAAGTCPACDRFNDYYEFSKYLPKNMFYICKSDNCWDVCNIISNARFVLGTSLHVRILSMQHFKPRATLSLGTKHLGFIIDWDNIKNIRVGLQNAPAYISKSLLNHDVDSDIKQLDFLEKDYINKSTWTHSL